MAEFLNEGPTATAGGALRNGAWLMRRTTGARASAGRRALRRRQSVSSSEEVMADERYSIREDFPFGSTSFGRKRRFAMTTGSCRLLAEV